MVHAYRPLAAMSVPALVEHHAELTRAVEAMTLLGDDVGAQAADERAQAVSAEMLDRLQAWLGPVPTADFLEAL